MRWEKMEILGITVRDLDSATRTFSDLFGLEFRSFEFPNGIAFENVPVPGGGTGTAVLDPNASTRMAIDTSGCFELIEDNGAPEGCRNIHFKVDDIGAAKDHAIAQGLTLAAEYKGGTLHEAVFVSPKLYGLRLCLISYSAPSAVEAIQGGRQDS